MNKTIKNEVFFKKATEYLVTELEKLEVTVENLSYHDTYFISYRGPNTIVHFQIKEIPAFIFGIWWNTNFNFYSSEALYGYLFAKQLQTVDNFSPIHSTFKEDLLIVFSKEGQITDFTVDLSFITKMKNSPEWAWYCDHYNHDPKDPDIKKSVIIKRYKDYLDLNLRTEQFKETHDREYLVQFYSVIKRYFKNCWIIEYGDNFYPRYEAVTLVTDSKDKLVDIISDIDQEKLNNLKIKFEDAAKKKNIYWSCPISITITYIKNKSWLNKKKIWDNI